MLSAPGRNFCSRYIRSSRCRIWDPHHPPNASPYPQRQQKMEVLLSRNVPPVPDTHPAYNDDNGSTSFPWHSGEAAVFFHRDDKNLSDIPDSDDHTQRNTHLRFPVFSAQSIHLLSIPSNGCHQPQKNHFLTTHHAPWEFFPVFFPPDRSFLWSTLPDSIYWIHLSYQEYVRYRPDLPVPHRNARYVPSRRHRH